MEVATLASRRSTRAHPAGATSPLVEPLESRFLLSTAVLTYHDDASSTGQNLTETLLTPANVNAADFGALTSTPLDGQVLAQPLYDPGVQITVGPSPGLHNVVYVATEHDSLYAIDGASGQILWQDSFLTSQLGVVVTTVPSADVGGGVSPENGITSTPVIDAATGTIFVCAATEEYANGQTHYVYTLHALSLASGAEQLGGPTVIADTVYNPNDDTFTYLSGPSVAGDGDGSVGGVLTFNAMRQNQRPGLTLANGTIYIAFASYGDNPPYHGWLLGYSAATLQLTAVFCADPNGSDAGIWQSGASISVDAQGNLYLVTGNGTFDTTLDPTTHLPIDADYGDTVLKLAVDHASTALHPNPNGWGLTVADYFTPYNQDYLSAHDQDLGSSGVLLLPAGAGGAGDTNLLLVGGKGGIFYLINCDDMGKFDPNADHVIQEFSISPSEVLDTPAYFDGTIYFTPTFFSPSVEAVALSGGVISATPSSVSPDTFGYPGPTVSISADSDSDGIVWAVEVSTGELRAYAAANLADELWTSDQAAGGRDQLGAVDHFVVSTVADGHVFVATQSALVIYGLLPSPAVPPLATNNLTATVVSNSQIQLSWPLRLTNATALLIQRQDGVNGAFAQIASVAGGATGYLDSSLSPGVPYTYRILAANGAGDAAYYSNQAAATISLPWQVVGQGDFDHNGVTDILLLNSASDQLGAWLLDSHSTPTWDAIGLLPAPFIVAGVGDFNADGTSDILLEDPTTGLLGIWTVSGGQVTTWTPLPALPSPWQLAGIGDFNGDGASDILIRNSLNGLTGVWLISNDQVTAWSLLGTAQPGFWNIAGIGDFTGNGTSDVLLWDPRSGLLGAWLIDDGQVNSWSAIGIVDPTAWQITGTGDFDHDGTSDILLTNAGLGITGTWLMSDGHMTGWSVIGAADPAVWRIVATGDFNGDGTSDVLLTDQTSGLVGAWLATAGSAGAWQAIGTLYYW